MKMRADLIFDRITYQGVEYFVVKEPLGQKFFQFPPHVFHILEQLDGNKSIEQLQTDFQREFAPKRITRHELQQILTRFHKDGLVTSNLTGQGAELLKRGRKNTRMELLGKLTNILAIRFRGFDPEGILNFLIRYTWWIFTPTAVVITSFMAMVALLSVLVNWSAFQASLPGFDQFFDLRQWLIFAGVLAFTKICHEFGHGLSCKRLGGECHEIGFMLLVLTPCLYCNVTDSWRLPNKWHRAAIGAAGMYVEIILATIATFIWWFAQPGLVQEISLKIMVVSSISTVLFNGNPLLRFDGYYILSDLLEIPNLNQKSTLALTTLLGRHWLGLEIPDDPLMPTNRPWAFALFTIAAFCYRWTIMFVIIVFLTKMLEPYNLESLGIGLALFSVAGMVGMPGYKLYKYMSVPGRLHQVKKIRFVVVLVLLVGLIGGVLLYPFPHYLRCSVVVLPEKLETVWIRQSGKLETCLVKPGDAVTAGEVLAMLSDVDLNLRLLQNRSQIAEKETELEVMIVRSSAGSLDALNRFAELTSEVRNLKSVLATIEAQAEALVLRSPIDGIILETPYQHQSNGFAEVQDVDSSPLLLQRHENIIAQRGQRFCEVADLSKWVGLVILSEQQVKFVREGQPTWILLYSHADKTIESEIAAIGESDRSIDRQQFTSNSPIQSQQATPNRNLSRPPDLLTEMVPALKQEGLQYFALVPVVTDEVQLKIGLGGQARLYTGSRSLAARLWWWINQNFRS